MNHPLVAEKMPWPENPSDGAGQLRPEPELVARFNGRVSAYR